MKHCPDCHAPNPTRLTRCYACGVLLDTPPRAAIKAGEATYPCLNCAGEVPYTAKDCPHCGKVVSGVSLETPHLSVSPPGWELEPLPDGTARLHRRGWGRVVKDFSAWVWIATIFVYIILALAIPLVGASRRSGGNVANFFQPWVFLAPFAVLVLLLLAWAIAGREEIRIGRDWLERRIGLGKWQRVKRIATGALSVQSDWYGGRSSYYQHRLMVSGRGGSVTLDSHCQNEIVVLFQVPDPRVPPELFLLGEIVASYTGWNFVKPIRF